MKILSKTSGLAMKVLLFGFLYCPTSDPLPVWGYIKDSTLE